MPHVSAVIAWGLIALLLWLLRRFWMPQTPEEMREQKRLCRRWFLPLFAVVPLVLGISSLLREDWYAALILLAGAVWFFSAPLWDYFGSSEPDERGTR